MSLYSLFKNCLNIVLSLKTHVLDNTCRWPSGLVPAPTSRIYRLYYDRGVRLGHIGKEVAISRGPICLPSANMTKRHTSTILLPF